MSCRFLFFKILRQGLLELRKEFRISSLQYRWNCSLRSRGHEGTYQESTVFHPKVWGQGCDAEKYREYLEPVRFRRVHGLDSYDTSLLTNLYVEGNRCGRIIIQVYILIVKERKRRSIWQGDPNYGYLSLTEINVPFLQVTKTKHFQGDSCSSGWNRKWIDQTCFNEIQIKAVQILNWDKWGDVIVMFAKFCASDRRKHVFVFRIFRECKRYPSDIVFISFVKSLTP